MTQTPAGSPLRKNQELVCRIDALASQGEGICRDMGQVLFIPFALPGETVRVRVQKVSKSLAFGKLLEVITPSEARQSPPCPLFGKCGGCALQHLDYASQLAHKGQQVKDVLLRIGKLEADVPPALGLGEPWRYRNKTALPVQEQGGQIAAGYYAPRSHRLVPVAECRIAHPACDTVTGAVLDWMQAQGISAYREEDRQGLVRHVITRVNARDQVMVTLAINGQDIPQAEALIQRLRRALPGFHSLHLTGQTAGDNVILGQTSRALYGGTPFIDWACGLAFELSPLSFFQVNSAISQQMYQQALKWAALRPQDTVVDLYSGAGAIALLAAGQCKRALGIEVSPQAVENARANAQRNQVTNAAFHLGEAEEILPRMQAEGLRADVVFLDPPRKGAHPQVLHAVAKASPRRIIYISCHPASQARDAALLHELGYDITRCQPYDMFCQTAQVENLLCFERVAAD